MIADAGEGGTNVTGDSYCFVVNPAACHGRGISRMPAVLGPLSAAGSTVRVEESSSLGHAATLAAEAADRGEIVVAVGGDGTVGRMAAAVAAAGGVLGIIPAGRGNDFARMLGIPADPSRAAAVLLRGGRREVDLIGVRAGDGPEQVVAGSVYLGIPSEGARIAAASRLPPGGLAYQIAGLRALLAWQPASFTVGTPAARRSDSLPWVLRRGGQLGLLRRRHARRAGRRCHRRPAGCDHGQRRLEALIRAGDGAGQPGQAHPAGPGRRHAGRPASR